MKTRIAALVCGALVVSLPVFASKPLFKLRALLNKDKTTDVELTTGAFDSAAVPPGNIAEVEIEAFAAGEEPGELEKVAEWGFDELRQGGFFTVSLPLPPNPDREGEPNPFLTRLQLLRVRAEIDGIPGDDHDDAPVETTVLLRPDLAVLAVDAPQQAEVGQKVVISASIRELNGDVAARAECNLYVDGQPAGTAGEFLVGPGGSVSCAFSQTFTTSGTRTLTVRADNARPRDWDTANNSLSTTIEIYHPAPKHMITPRAYHNAVLLKSGKVLVIGGRGPGNARLQDAELYDPATRSWSSAGSLPNPLWFSTATLLNDGRVFVAGGFYEWPGQFWANTWFYTEGQGWTAGTPLPTARAFHNAVLLQSGKVLVVTGTYPGYLCSYPTDSQLFDPAANSGAGSWTASGSIHQNRSSASVALLSNGKVLLTAGPQTNCPSNNNGYAQAELYDPGTGLWTVTGSMGTPRIYVDLMPLANGYALAAGGLNNSGTLSGAEFYNAATGTFSPTASLSSARYQDTATILPSGKIALLGGTNGTNPLASGEIYDPSLGTWSAAPATLATARYLHSATLLLNGKILVAGGYGAGLVLLDSAELLDEGH
jgi:hypothetical protein